MKSSRFVLFGIVLVLMGCGGEKLPEIVEVSGTITMEGEPLDQVKVTFMPDGEKGNLDSRSSWGETDSNGKYTLKYQIPNQDVSGASVGFHRVVLRDLIPNRSRGEQGDVEQEALRRFQVKYTSAPKTDLSAEVKSGEAQTFDFDVTPDG